MIKKALREYSMREIPIYFLYQRFRVVRESFENETRSGKFSTSRTSESANACTVCNQKKSKFD